MCVCVYVYTKNIYIYFWIAFQSMMPVGIQGASKGHPNWYYFEIQQYTQQLGHVGTGPMLFSASFFIFIFPFHIPPMYLMYLYVQHVWNQIWTTIHQVICCRVAQPPFFFGAAGSLSFASFHRVLRNPGCSAAVEWYWICQPVEICVTQRTRDNMAGLASGNSAVVAAKPCFDRYWKRFIFYLTIFKHQVQLTDISLT